MIVVVTVVVADAVVTVEEIGVVCTDELGDEEVGESPRKQK